MWISARLAAASASGSAGAPPFALADAAVPVLRRRRPPRVPRLVFFFGAGVSAPSSAACSASASGSTVGICVGLCAVVGLGLRGNRRLGLRLRDGLRRGALRPRRPRRLLGLALRGDRSLDGGLAEHRGVRRAVEHAVDARVHRLADELRGAAPRRRRAVELRDRSVRVVEPDLDELQLELGALLDRRLRGELLERPSSSTAKWSEWSPSFSSRKKRRFVEASICSRREAPGPIRMLPARAETSMRNAFVRGFAAAERAQLALEVDRRGRLGHDDPIAGAGRALLRQDLARSVGDVLPRHLDEAERRDLDDVRLRSVALELVLQRVLDRLPVGRVRHVDEVDDDDPADVAQAQLADDLLDRLEVVLRDRVLEPRAGALRARADEAPGVHVDHGERLGVVEDQVAAGRKVDAAVERRLDLRVDAERLEQRRLLLVADHLLHHVRRGLLQVADDALVRRVVVDQRALEVAGEEVARDAERQLRLLVDERRRLRRLRLVLDRLPELLEEDEVALDVLGGRALRGRADDHAAFLHLERLDDLLQARPLVVVEPARDAEPFAERDVDDEAAGQRDLGREPRALRLHRVLDRLDEHLLAALDQVLDLAAVALALELGHDDLVDVEEAVLLEPDLDERGLHAGQHVVDRAEVDVPGDRSALRTLEVDLGDAVVLEDRDALLADVGRDEQLALRGRQRRPLLRRTAARLVRSPLTALRANLFLLLLRPLGLLLALGLRRSGFRRGARGARRRGLLAALAATRAAAALRAGGVGCRFPAGCGGGGRYVCRRGWSGCLRCRRLLLRFRRNQGSGKRCLLAVRAAKRRPPQATGARVRLSEAKTRASLHPGYQWPRAGSAVRSWT